MKNKSVCIGSISGMNVCDDMINLNTLSRQKEILNVH